jgi:[ribosomal protein S5]-alanine N-acetyltransferase
MTKRTTFGRGCCSRPGQDPVLPADTERLVFRWWQAEDFALATHLWGDPRVTALIDSRPSLDAAAVRERLTRELSNARALGIQYWPMFRRDNRELAGCCGLKPSELGTDVLELGFHLRAESWGSGYATEAARSVIALAFDRLGVRALFAGHHPENDASRRVLAKLGFRHTGETLFAPTGLMHPAYLLDRNGASRISFGGSDVLE